MFHSDHKLHSRITDHAGIICLLASAIELLPWFNPWHSVPQANFKYFRTGDFFEYLAIKEAVRSEESSPK